jgi:hypothetical protein
LKNQFIHKTTESYVVWLAPNSWFMMYFYKWLRKFR